MDGRSQKPGSRWAWAVRGASGLAVASAVSAATAADGPRAAVLLPPRVGAPIAGPVVARGAIDDDPLATTPVVRKGAPRPLVPPVGAKAAPDWLSSMDPNVTPAGGLAPAKGSAAARTVTPAKLTTDPRPATGSPKLTPPPPLFTPGEPNPLAKGVEAFKGFATPEGSAALPPAGAPQPDARSPRDALKGTAANGAPVLAGPPAWRWYGYGSVTPGANAYAPSGQYPRASANWYSVTKATPGAFPVPVVNPFHGGPGAEPPSYAGVAPTPTRPSFTPVLTDTSVLPPPPRLNPPPVASAPLPLPVPTVPSPAAPMPVSVAPPAPVSIVPPVFNPVPLPPPPAVRAPEPLATVEPPPARPTPPPVLPPLSVVPMSAPPALPVLPTTPPPALPSLVPSVPAVAPVSAPAASEDDVRWKSNPTTRPAPPPPGTWTRPPVARGQIGDDLQEPADPVETIVQAVCRGRATGVDIRHTGPLQVTVCFETRTPTDATALVRDLSARPELARYEVNFCVLVK